MSYEDLVAQVAARSGLTHERVRAVLDTLPEALMLLREGERIRTPLGIFTMVRTKNREIMLPDGQRKAPSKSKLVVKLRPGTQMRRMA